MKEDLIKRLGELLNRLSNLNNNLISLLLRHFINNKKIPLLGNLGGISEEDEKEGNIIDVLTVKCILLQKQIDECSENDYATLYDLKKQVYVLENSINRKLQILGFYPSFIFVYFIVFTAIFIIDRINVPQFIKAAFYVDDPFIRIISFGLAGAFLYLIISINEKFENNKSSDPKLAKVIDITTRFVISVLVPGIIIALFVTEDGQLRQLNFSPDLISFACGYSTKLVVQLFNKIVEKGSKMIDAI